MKHFSIFFLAFSLLAGMVTSCKTSSPDKISASDIVSQYNQYLKDSAQQEHFTVLEIGTYRRDTSRLALRELQAAGLVTYSVQRYPWWERIVKPVKKPFTVTRYYWGDEYKETTYKTVIDTSYNFEDHYVVTVDLTRKGRSLVVEDLPSPVEKVDKDLLQPEVDESKYAWNKVDLSESWPQILNPFPREEKEVKTVATKEAKPSSKSSNKKSSNSSSSKKWPEIVRIDSTIHMAYWEIATSCEEVLLKSYNLKAVKARNIQIKEVDGAPVASAEVIVETQNTTDAGRILDRKENGERTLVPVSLNYYIDKGWVLNTDTDSTPSESTK